MFSFFLAAMLLGFVFNAAPGAVFSETLRRVATLAPPDLRSLRRGAAGSGRDECDGTGLSEPRLSPSSKQSNGAAPATGLA